MAAAVECIEIAIEKGDPILVHGDYDVDGMSATAVLVHGLRALGADVTGFVPHRTRDGYDLGPAGLARAEQEGARLIITADCGVSALKGVRAAHARGIEVIVTDHHRPGPVLPDAVAVVNPNRTDSTYPFGGLAGVGVAFKLVSQLYERKCLTDVHLNQHLDLVALGTVADQAPLVDENRVLVQFGLRAWEYSRKPGLRALRSISRCAGRALDAGDIAFRLAPRLNATGRVGEAADGLRLLLTESPDEAEALARHVDGQNALRRTTDRQVLEEAGDELARSFDPSRDRVVVLWRDGWHPGVLGITASRLVDRLDRPVILVGFSGERGRGSARSVEGFHLFRALEACAPSLERFGGHEMAAGFDIRRSRLDDFLTSMRAHAERELPADRLERDLRIDLQLGLEAVTPEFYRQLSYLGPFGNSNPRPLIVTRRVRIREARSTRGDGAHLKGTLDSGNARIDAIGFGMGTRVSEANGVDAHDVVFEVHPDHRAGRPRLQAHVIDFRTCD
jgi:single-stranded-DNA-specific exonuclease